MICLTGAGEKAFCTGGDQKQRAETGDYGPSETGLFEVDTLHRVIRDVPKPVIAAVNGFAIGGGHVLHVLCDLTIAADTAVFGQNGPRVGSFDAGFGTGYLARVVGEKRAREIWFLCRRYSAQQAAEWGLVNKVVPADQLKSEVRAWADEILMLSPTALKVLKQSFNTDTEQFASVGQMAYSTLKMFGETPEAQGRHHRVQRETQPRIRRLPGQLSMFTAEQLEFAAAIERFCADNCGTVEQRAQLTQGLSNSPELLQRLAELGWLGVSVPVDYGGGGAGMVEECIFLEETARGQAPIHAYGTGLTAAQTYLRHGTESQKKEVVGNLCAGHFEAIALSEPGAGSDLGAVRTRAVRDGDSFVVNGQKTWITAAHLADHLLVLTRTDPNVGKHHGLTLLYLSTSTPGLDIKAIQTMDGHTVNDVFFTDVVVPADNVVGGIGDAWHRLMRGLNVERLIIAAMSLGAARRSLQDTIAYVRTREQFGKPIGAFQAVRHRLADLAAEIECCRAYVYQVAAQIDAGLEDQLAREGSIAKLKCTEVAKRAALEGVQLMGGNGYTVEFGMESQVRKALAPPIYGGANEIQREIIGKSLGL